MYIYIFFFFFNFKAFCKNAIIFSVGKTKTDECQPVCNPLPTEMDTGSG